MPCLVLSAADDETRKITLGHPLLDDYLVFVAARARTSTWLAVAYDLKVFFEVVGKEPAVVTTADVFAFLSAQRAPRRGERVVRLEDGEAGLAARTIARRLSSVRGLYGYLCAREDTGVRRNPVPARLAARRPGARRGRGGVPCRAGPGDLPPAAPHLFPPAAGGGHGGGGDPGAGRSRLDRVDPPLPAPGQRLAGGGVPAGGGGDRGAGCPARRKGRPVSRSPARRPAVEDLVGAYRADLQAAGMFAGHPVTSVARMFFTRVGPGGWARLPLAAQCALPLKDRRVAGWLIVTGRLRPSADCLVACRPYLGEVAARHHRAFYDRFAAASAGLGFDPIVTRLQWSALAQVTALAGLGPGQVTQAVIDEGRQALTAAIGRHRPGSHGPKALSAALFGLQTTLFHLGVLGAAPRKTSPDRSADRAAQWASVPPQPASTLAG